MERRKEFLQREQALYFFPPATACAERRRTAKDAARCLHEEFSPELSRSTGIDQKVKALQSHENPDVRALSKVITSAWSTQLAEERQRRELKSKPGPKPKGTGAAGCAACLGGHRAHTCM